MAQTADFGICLARTDPDAPKHAGITYFIVDMHAPGIDIRPLRELTGAAMFNEVFMTDVFVPDDAVIGQPGEGWRIGRTTLANERVSMSSGAAFGIGVESLIRTMARRQGPELPPGFVGELGHLLVEAQSIALLGLRATLRTLSGVDPGSGSSVRKLLGVEHEQRVQEMGMALYGADGAVLDGKAERWEAGILVHPLPDHRRRDQRGAAQRHCRADPGAAPRPRTGPLRHEGSRRAAPLEWRGHEHAPWRR